MNQLNKKKTLQYLTKVTILPVQRMEGGMHFEEVASPLASCRRAASAADLAFAMPGFLRKCFIAAPMGQL